MTTEQLDTSQHGEPEQPPQPSIAPLIEALRSQREAALDTCANLQSEVAFLRARVAYLERQLEQRPIVAKPPLEPGIDNG